MSAALQRWPARNYFAELAPRSDEPHPIDKLLERYPGLRTIVRRARRLLASEVQKQAKLTDLLDFEAQRNLLDATRVEVAFNLGFENGMVLGRAEGLRRRVRPTLDRYERSLLLELRAALAHTKTSPRRVEVLLLELAWAFALGAERRISASDALFRPARGRRGPSQRSAGRSRRRPSR